MSARAAWLVQAGCLDYAQVWAWQRQLQDNRRNNPDRPDVLLLLEHPAVYTLGRGSSLAHLKFDPQHPPAPVYRIERGGEVTHHAPGQLVGYPILNLRHHRCDLHWYLRQLEAVLILVLANYGLTGERIEGLTGVWVEGKKLAAIGIQVSRWISLHGFALNVCPDLAGFEAIVPCGISDRAVGSLVEFCPDVRLEVVRSQVAGAFAQTFELDLQPCSLEQLQAEENLTAIAGDP
ncbi:lipoyl(octanoyl) transferase LipB [Synechococcus elongatus]|uniref:Octanoyltransferase n=2 Tax=Synechococcus elongatus TaxID=32046 RepID=LIPB_SYNE7|nr:lipoyl(octanoyl) transferase LipB [Synechococcus elongatus]Q31KN6.1 RecName: Full=Octanoyltransferase; AltName: Full=Lipoate-protein ligase B; AltName: Full=Lipoyl/octanoyl transferase; AltName: Full=Octanoyl-[acyl-carrier-protein]-protein N-octanoyltransferase [Synechococcus elongatus PCC 7942 = FACHB-805]Q5N180.1 RecName: Full=Octanoyltransferase; AltName: Full=Lipoate-protein ligase B; AltName: Full=Lipoyl/octanoyl transferase; AltName: Full=Octanoyl-[acyl-carrier-protein]-protein N-octanoy